VRGKMSKKENMVETSSIQEESLLKKSKKELVKIELYMDSKEKGYLTALAGLMKHKSLEDFLTDLVTDELKSRYFSSNGRRAVELDYSIDRWGIKPEE